MIAIRRPSRKMTSMPSESKAFKDLVTLFSSIENEEECGLLLKDLLTPQERETIAERWQLIRSLASGMTQRDIAKKLKISISKITRGSHELQYGSGGFKHFLKKLQMTRS